MRAEIDELNEFLFDRVHNGPYRCAVSSKELSTARAAGSTTAKSTSSPANPMIASIDLHRVSTWM